MFLFRLAPKLSSLLFLREHVADVKLGPHDLAVAPSAGIVVCSILVSDLEND